MRLRIRPGRCFDCSILISPQVARHRHIALPELDTQKRSCAMTFSRQQSRRRAACVLVAARATGKALIMLRIMISTTAVAAVLARPASLPRSAMAIRRRVTPKALVIHSLAASPGCPAAISRSTAAQAPSAHPGSPAASWKASRNRPGGWSWPGRAPGLAGRRCRAELAGRHRRERRPAPRGG